MNIQPISNVVTLPQAALCSIAAREERRAKLTLAMADILRDVSVLVVGYEDASEVLLKDLQAMELRLSAIEAQAGRLSEDRLSLARSRIMDDLLVLLVSTIEILFQMRARATTPERREAVSGAWSRIQEVATAARAIDQTLSA